MNSLEESLFSNSFYDFNSSSSNDKFFFNSEPLVSQDIFAAANIGNIEVVSSLISNKPYLSNAKNRENWNAIMYATYYNHQEIVLFLLEKNAPLHACNGKGQNVLMIASSMGYDTLVNQFLNWGSNIESRDEKDWTPLLHAVNHDYTEVVKVLLKSGANPNALVRYTGKTPLITAAYNGSCQMVEMLLQFGAYLDFKDSFGKDALSYAIEIGHKDVITILERFYPKDGLAAKYDFSKSVAMKDENALSSLKFRNINTSLNEPILSSCSPNLESLLFHYGLSSYIPLFQQNAVDLLIFLGLSDRDLKECGVSELGARRKMLDIISKWHCNSFLTNGPINSSHELKLLTEIQELREQLSESKQERQECESVIIELKKRLRECHTRAFFLRDHLLQSLQRVLPITKVAEFFSNFFSYLEDFIHLTSDIGSDFHLRN